MVAAIDEEIAACVGELALLDVLDPCAIHANRHIMLSLTRDSILVDGSFDECSFSLSFLQALA